MALIKTSYPSSSTAGVTITLTSLPANGTAGVFTSGRSSAAINNTANVDLDHLLSGKIQVGTTTPVASRSINIYVYAPYTNTTGTATYPDTLLGTDANVTFTSANTLNSAVRFAANIIIDVTASASYYFAPVSVASLFGGSLPQFWGVYLAHDTGSNLSATAGNLVLTYDRIQGQTV